MSRSKRVLPYRVIPDGVIELRDAGWRVVTESLQRTVLTGEPLPEWDAVLQCRLERTIGIRHDFRELLGLECDGSVFEMAVIVTTAKGQSRRAVASVKLPSNIVGDISVSFPLDSQRLAHDLLIECALHLCQPVLGRDPLAPTVPGSRLWSHADRIRIEGGSARLSMYDTDLILLRREQALERARLLVDIRSDDPEESFEQAVIVWLNTHRQDFIDRLRNGDFDAMEDAWTAIVRNLCISALLGDWWDKSIPYSEGSLGATISRWLRHIGQGKLDVDDLHLLVKTAPADFDARVNCYVARLVDQNRRLPGDLE